MDYKQKVITLLDSQELSEEQKRKLKEIFPELAENEDKKIRDLILETIYSVYGDGKEYNDCLAYLEKQKEQKPLEPSYDELQRHQDELYDFKVFAAKQAREHHISFVHDFEWNNFCAELLSYFNDKEQKSSIKEPKYESFEEGNATGWRIKQQPTEWSEEDEKMIERLITRLNWITYNTRTDGTSPNITFFDEIDWLKSLRPSWKPSEHQLSMLKAVIRNPNNAGAESCHLALESLLEDLKKLM